MTMKSVSVLTNNPFIERQKQLEVQKQQITNQRQKVQLVQTQRRRQQLQTIPSSPPKQSRKSILRNRFNKNSIGNESLSNSIDSLGRSSNSNIYSSHSHSHSHSHSNSNDSQSNDVDDSCSNSNYESFKSLASPRSQKSITISPNALPKKESKWVSTRIQRMSPSTARTTTTTLTTPTTPITPVQVLKKLGSDRGETALVRSPTNDCTAANDAIADRTPSQQQTRPNIFKTQRILKTPTTPIRTTTTKNFKKNPFLKTPISPLETTSTALEYKRMLKTNKNATTTATSTSTSTATMMTTTVAATNAGLKSRQLQTIKATATPPTAKAKAKAKATPMTIQQTTTPPTTTKRNFLIRSSATSTSSSLFSKSSDITLPRTPTKKTKASDSFRIMLTPKSMNKATSTGTIVSSTMAMKSKLIQTKVNNESDAIVTAATTTTTTRTTTTTTKKWKIVPPAISPAAQRRSSSTTTVPLSSCDNSPITPITIRKLNTGTINYNSTGSSSSQFLSKFPSIKRIETQEPVQNNGDATIAGTSISHIATTTPTAKLKSTSANSEDQKNELPTYNVANDGAGRSSVGSDPMAPGRISPTFLNRVQRIQSLESRERIIDACVDACVDCDKNKNKATLMTMTISTPSLVNNENQVPATTATDTATGTATAETVKETEKETVTSKDMNDSDSIMLEKGGCVRSYQDPALETTNDTFNQSSMNNIRCGTYMTMVDSVISGCLSFDTSEPSNNDNSFNDDSDDVEHCHDDDDINDNNDLDEMDSSVSVGEACKSEQAQAAAKVLYRRERYNSYDSEVSTASSQWSDSTCTSSQRKLMMQSDPDFQVFNERNNPTDISASSGLDVSSSFGESLRSLVDDDQNSALNVQRPPGKMVRRGTGFQGITLLPQETENAVKDSNEMSSVTPRSRRNLCTTKAMNSSMKGKSNGMVQRKANVGFLESNNEIVEVEHWKDLTNDDASCIWWTKSECNEIKSEFGAVLFMMESNKPIDENNHCSRGLENKTEDGAWTLYEVHRDSKNAVLDIQDDQKRNKIKDPIAIANAYKEISAKAAHRAYKLGRQDAKIAEKCTEDLLTKVGCKYVPSSVLLDLDITMPTTMDDDPIAMAKINCRKEKHRSSLKVRFGDRITGAHIVPGWQSISIEEFESVWYTAKELNDMEAEYLSVLQQCSEFRQCRNKTDDGDKDRCPHEVSLRGLECRTQEGQVKLYKQQQEAWQIVLSTQSLQKKQGLSDSDEIAIRYNEVTATSTRKAIRRARKDRIEAKKCNKSDETCAMKPPTIVTTTTIKPETIVTTLPCANNTQISLKENSADDACRRLNRAASASPAFQQTKGHEQQSIDTSLHDVSVETALNNSKHRTVGVRRWKSLETTQTASAPLTKFTNTTTVSKEAATPPPLASKWGFKSSIPATAPSSTLPDQPTTRTTIVNISGKADASRLPKTSAKETYTHGMYSTLKINSSLSYINDSSSYDEYDYSETTDDSVSFMQVCKPEMSELKSVYSPDDSLTLEHSKRLILHNMTTPTPGRRISMSESSTSDDDCGSIDASLSSSKIGQLKRAIQTLDDSLSLKYTKSRTDPEYAMTAAIGSQHRSENHGNFQRSKSQKHVLNGKRLPSFDASIFDDEMDEQDAVADDASDSIISSTSSQLSDSSSNKNKKILQSYPDFKQFQEKNNPLDIGISTDLELSFSFGESMKSLDHNSAHSHHPKGRMPRRSTGFQGITLMPQESIIKSDTNIRKVQPVSPTRKSPATEGATKSSLKRKSTRKDQSKNIVGFLQENDQILEIDHWKDYTDEDISLMWWSKGEYSEIKSEYGAVIYMMESNKPIDENHNCSRGLEKKTEDGAWGLYEVFRDAKNAVLDVQDEQKCKKIKDPLAIAEAYKEKTSKAAKEAYKRGRQDAKIAELCTEDLLTKVGCKYVRSSVLLDLDEDYSITSPTFSSEVESRGKAINTSKQKNSSNVAFNDSLMKVHVIPGLRSIPKEEFEGVWYTATEMNDVELEYLGVLKLLSDFLEREDVHNGRLPNDFMMRGLECRTMEGKVKLHRRQRDAWEVVLRTQRQQKNQGISDPIELAIRYNEVTATSTRKAIRRAKKDHMEAKKV